MANYKSSLHKDIDDVFKSGGYLSRHFNGYSPRPPQIQMTETIADAIAITKYNLSNDEQKMHHAIVEAGTGTGKSFALSIPLAITIARENAARKPGERQHKGLIVTATTTLQSQLYKKDLPLVQKVLKDMGLTFKSALYKGKANYLCTQRFMKFLNGNMSSSDREEMSKILPGITDKDNNLDLEKCDKEAMPIKPSDEFWEKINIGLESSCYGCPYKDTGCYYHAIRNGSQDADIYVGNHAMLMQDLKMRLKTGKGTLPEYDYVVIDEAHHVEMGLAEDFSSKIEKTALWGIGKTIEWLVNLKEIKQSRAIVIENAYKSFQKEVLKVFDFFKKQCNGQSIPWSHQIIPTGINLDGTASELLTNIAKVLMNTTKPGDRNRMNSVTNRILALVKDLKAFAFNDADSDYFFNIKCDRNGGDVSLLMTPLNGGELMKKVLFDRVPVIISSATIKVGENLDVFGQKIGNLYPTDFEQLCVDSPFDYEKNSIFYIPADALGSKEQGYDQYCQNEMKRLVDLSKGRAFLLFTSKTTLEQYYKVLAPYFKTKGYECFKQGDTDRNTLVNQFKKSKHGVLFGGDSFWEGVDVPGRILCNVIMQKLPFNTPDPISNAKQALVKAAGRDDFLECQVFPAIIKFKQGVGRLIRDKNDGGVITLLDGRVFLKKNFGKYFIQALPKGMGKTVEFEDLAPFVEPE
jgi:ATP-dependent DNA helicase DinG